MMSNSNDEHFTRLLHWLCPGYSPGQRLIGWPTQDAGRGDEYLDMNAPQLKPGLCKKNGGGGTCMPPPPSWSEFEGGGEIRRGERETKRELRGRYCYSVS